MNAKSTSPKATRREWTGLAVLSLVCLMLAADLSVLYLVVPQISAALEPSSAQLRWIVDVYGFLLGLSHPHGRAGRPHRRAAPPAHRGRGLRSGEPVHRPAEVNADRPPEHEAWVIQILAGGELLMDAAEVEALRPEEARELVHEHWSRPRE